ncbi:unnamed protein product [Hydatigera taeniaeformis]|uniref:Fibronectin type-III domain-containing protein n=1 Tax=Hydatigena taeniaeformis TaxID=6205 RepID=A0A0R3X849_HYDTA|nr:unnamed protein product [Hydatigera taeniaeformis]
MVDRIHWVRMGPQEYRLTWDIQNVDMDVNRLSLSAIPTDLGDQPYEGTANFLDGRMNLERILPNKWYSVRLEASKDQTTIWSFLGSVKSLPTEVTMTNVEDLNKPTVSNHFLWLYVNPQTYHLRWDIKGLAKYNMDTITIKLKRADDTGVPIEKSEKFQLGVTTLEDLDSDTLYNLVVKATANSNDIWTFDAKIKTLPTEMIMTEVVTIKATALPHHVSVVKLDSTTYQIKGNFESLAVLNADRMAVTAEAVDAPESVITKSERLAVKETNLEGLRPDTLYNVLLEAFAGEVKAWSYATTFKTSTTAKNFSRIWRVADIFFLFPQSGCNSIYIIITGDMKANAEANNKSPTSTKFMIPSLRQHLRFSHKRVLLQRTMQSCVEKKSGSASGQRMHPPTKMEDRAMVHLLDTRDGVLSPTAGECGGATYLLTSLHPPLPHFSRIFSCLTQ